MRISHLLLTLLLPLITSCWGDDEDPLPDYSESGSNTFGAYHEHDRFMSSDDMTSAKILVSNDRTFLVFEGRLKRKKHRILFQIPDFTPQEYSHLLSLHNSYFEYTTLSVLTGKEGEENEITLQYGSLSIKKAQSLIVDKTIYGVILSGRFGAGGVFKNDENRYFELNDGRFDVVIKEENFIKY